jgi:hypothetical protein
LIVVQRPPIGMNKNSTIEEMLKFLKAMKFFLVTKDVNTAESKLFLFFITTSKRFV